MIFYDSDGLNYPVWQVSRSSACRKFIPAGLCTGTSTPHDFKAYHEDKSCLCACLSKNIKTNILITYEILKRISLDISKLGDILTYAIDFDYKATTYSDHFSDPRMTEDNSTSSKYEGKDTS